MFRVFYPEIPIRKLFYGYTSLNKSFYLKYTCCSIVWGQKSEISGGGSGGMMNWEIGIDIYTLICIK